MAIVSLIIIISGCISDQDTAPKPNVTQNSTVITPQLSITAEVETGLIKLHHTGGNDITLRDIIIVIEQGKPSAIYEKIGQNDDRFMKGDTLDLTLKGISLNGKALDIGRISINNSEAMNNSEDMEEYQTTITLVHIPSGSLLTRIVSSEGFFS